MDARSYVEPPTASVRRRGDRRVFAVEARHIPSRHLEIIKLVIDWKLVIEN